MPMAQLFVPWIASFPSFEVILGTSGASRFALGGSDGKTRIPEYGFAFIDIEVGPLKMGSLVPLPTRFEHIYLPNLLLGQTSFSLFRS